MFLFRVVLPEVPVVLVPLSARDRRLRAYVRSAPASRPTTSVPTTRTPTTSVPTTSALTNPRLEDEEAPARASDPAGPSSNGDG